MTYSCPERQALVAAVLAARDPSAPAATIPAQPAPADAHSPAAVPEPAADMSALWAKAIAKVSPPVPAANVQVQEPAPASIAPAVHAPVVAVTNYAELWRRAVAKASAPVHAKLKAMGLE